MSSQTFENKEHFQLMSIHIPKVRLKVTNSIEKKEIIFQEPDASTPRWEQVGTNLFKDDSWHVLVQDLKEAWNFPSSYQLINRLVKNSQLTRDDFKTTTKSMNEWLILEGLISDILHSYFYVSLEKLYSVISNKELFYPEQLDEIPSQDDLGNTDKSTHEEDPNQVKDETASEIVTVGQVFSHYSIPVQESHAQFNSLTNVTKLNYYKTLPNSYKYLPNNKLSYNERDLIARDNNIYEDVLESDPQYLDNDDEPKRKRYRKTRKNNIDVDPNSIELAESLIPGQGYIQEFNVSHICKVPNYNLVNHVPNVVPVNAGTGNTLLGIQSQASNSTALDVSSPATQVKLETKVAKNIQQLSTSDNDSHNNAKYLYTKNYRGPGSGNYKDAALMNRINKVPTTLKVGNLHKSLEQLEKVGSTPRAAENLKGLVHDEFHKLHWDSVLYDQKRLALDYENLEMLHNNLLFNFLINTYRNIAEDTWKSYYDFKLIDFEQEFALAEEEKEIAASRKFVEDMKTWKVKEAQRKEKLLRRADMERIKVERKHIKQMEKQRKRDDRARRLEEKKRHDQLAATFNDPFGDDFDLLGEDIKIDSPEQDDDLDDDNLEELDHENLEIPLHPPKPIETPQLDVLNRFTLPIVYPEIVHLLPLEQRSINRANKNDDIPAIKKVIRYVSTYPDSQHPEILNKIEIIKIPNSNAIGWDNLRKFRKE